MKQDFDSSVPVHEQLLRVAKAKEPGRKHQHRPGIRFLERKKLTAKRRSAMLKAKRQRFTEAVAAYWRGERETYPKLT